jgi:hypothetical protein
VEVDLQLIQVLLDELGLAIRADKVLEHRSLAALRNRVELKLSATARLLCAQVLKEDCVFEQLWQAT